MKNLTKKGGFTLVEIMIVVAIIGLLAAIAIPNFNQARTNAVKGACIANLRQIEGATTLYAIDNNANPASPAALVPVYIQQTPECKGGGVYTIGNVMADPPTRPECNVAGHEL